MLESRDQIVRSALRIRSTIGNSVWLSANASVLHGALPSDWTPISNATLHLRFGLELKAAGVGWREVDDLVLAMKWLEKTGIAEIRRNPLLAGQGENSLIIRKSQKSFR